MSHTHRGHHWYADRKGIACKSKKKKKITIGDNGGQEELQDKREKMRREPPHRCRRREHQQQSRSPSVCVIIKTQPGSHQLGSTRCETTVTMSKHGGEEAAGPGVAAERHLANQLARCPLRFQSVRLLGCLGNVCLGVCGCQGDFFSGAVVFL